MVLDAGSQGRMLLGTVDYNGTPLANLTTLSYSGYRSSPDGGNNLAVTLQINVDYDLTDATSSWQGRLVFEPYFTAGSGTILQSTWYTWNPLTGYWWMSSDAIVGNVSVGRACPPSSPCTWAQVLANYPNAGVHASLGAVQFKAGAPWPSFDGNVDAFTIGVSGSNTTYDFEQPCGNGHLDGGEPCDDGVANGSSGSCCNANCTAKADGVSCDDGQFCTVNDVCSSGTCGGSTRDCVSSDAAPVDFETSAYATGTINGQDGWSSSGAAGSGCAVYDHAVTTNTYGYGSFGGQSLRISNAVTSGCFSDQTFSKSLPNEVGETTATNGGMSGGTRRTHFEAEWNFASTVPGAEQPGLAVVASPDRGDGARMSYVRIADTSSGLEVGFYDYRDVAPFGSAGNESDGCGAGDAFAFTTVATGLDRMIPHTIKVTMDTYEGPRNDVVKVFVDGVLEHTGTSWEDYFRWCEVTDVSRTVDSILFRTGGTAAPATAGKGFLIDNLTLRSGFELDACETAGCDETGDACLRTAKAAGPICRGAAGSCDLAEHCDGTNITCPIDTKSTDVCRSSAGPCDIAESCDGVNDDCPADHVATSAAVCRPTAGTCDLADHCDGTNVTCPVDAKRTDVCRPSAGTCDVAESCDGVDNDCPADAKSSALCRPAAGPCDVAESCDNVNNDCPVDGFATAATVCRNSAGVCDIADHCTGSSAPCPADAKSTAVCRAAATECDVAESCDGLGNNCPSNSLKPDNTGCHGTNDNTCLNTCQSGTCTPDLTANCCGNGLLEVGEQCEDGNQDTGDGCGAVCRYELIPGNTDRAQVLDNRTCVVEWSVVNPSNALDGRGRPNRRQTCTEGDPTCDFDSDTHGCTFQMVACLNNTDPHLPGCPHLGVAFPIRIVSPSVRRDPTNANQIAAALQNLRDPATGVGGLTIPLAPPQVGLCSEPFPVRVPLHESPRRRKQGIVRIATRAQSSQTSPNRLWDVDVIDLVCAP